MSLVEVIENGKDGKPFTAREFLDNLRGSNEQWWKGIEGRRSPWVFRGVGHYPTWSLLPFAWRQRDVNRLTPLIEICESADLVDHNTPSVAFGSPDYHRVTIQTAEIEALFRFSRMASEIGFPVEMMPGQSPLEAKRRVGIVGDDFAVAFNPMIAQLAQHHGIPTRLLDWTRSGSIAAYFAVSPRSIHQEATAIAVWAYRSDRRTFAGYLKPMSMSPEIISVDVIEPLRFGNAFLAAQQGLFTKWGCPHSQQSQVGWPSLEELLRNLTPREGDPNESVLRGFVLKRDQVNELLELLEREGVNAAGLMPTLDNVAKDVMDRWLRESPFGSA